MSFASFSRNLSIVVLTVSTAALLGACSSTSTPKPAELGANPARIGIKQVWTVKLGKAVPASMQTRVQANQVYAASSDGVVASVDARTGAESWRIKLDSGVVAGIGGNEKHLALITRENELIVLLSDSGKEIWRQRLTGLSLTTPLVAGERVFTLTSDKTVSAFDLTTGRKIWSQQRTGEALLLGQSSILTAVGNTLVVGLGGHMVGMNPGNGNVSWDVTVANSRGTNEVERLVDIVAGFSRLGDQLCLRSYQASVSCMDAASGTLLWSKPANGSAGVSGDASLLVTPESNGRVIALNRSNGERVWTSESLSLRELSSPLMLGRSIVIADSSGWIHFVSREDGSLLDRVKIEESGIAAAPVMAGKTLVVAGRLGTMYGFRPE